MLSLWPERSYKFEVVIFGGASENAIKDLSLEAGKASHRIEVVMPSQNLPFYTFGEGWIEEAMGGPRVMGDATLLPNGKVILLNGAQVSSRCCKSAANDLTDMVTAWYRSKRDMIDGSVYVSMIS